MRQRQVLSGEIQPDLSRKIYPVCYRLFKIILIKGTSVVSKADPSAQKKERNKTIRWVVTIFFVTILISGTISLVSDALMAGSGMAVCFLILLFIISEAVLSLHHLHINSI